MKNYISQLNGKEQNAIHCIKKLLASQLNALMIYCFGCRTISTITRSAFVKKQFREERKFDCDLLIITPDELVVTEEKKAEMESITAHFGQVNMTIHPLSFMLQQLNKGNLFFNWIHKNGMLLHNLNHSANLLPDPPGGEYWPQATFFYLNDPEMVSYLDVTMQTPGNKKPEEKAPVPPSLEIKLTLDSERG